jgi:hypothetical protein
MTTKKTAKKTATTTKEQTIQISAPKIATSVFKLIGTAPYVQLRFSEKARNALMASMKAGTQANKSRKKEPRDFDEDFRQALHVSEDGWNGIPASSIRAAAVSACRLIGFKMTIAKLSVFVLADGLDRVDGVPLIKIKGKPEPLIMHARNANGGCDLRVRAKYWPWEVEVAMQYDEGQFSATDVTNLLSRVGAQVGLGEGRHDSKASAGMGWGTFKLG